jgi:hypothetical protein
MTTREEDIRLALLNTLLTTPHRDLAKVWPVHRDMVERDPLFYVRLAAWYADHGEVRDHKEMFVVTLALSEFDGHRDVGLALLRSLPPYELVRVVDFIHGRKSSRKVRVADNKEIRQSKARQLIGAILKKKKHDECKAEAKVETKVDEFGLFKNVPRSIKTEVTRYLKEREADHDWFDSSVLVGRKALKRLYAVLHIRPDERAQKILFEQDPPADSRLFALRELAKADNPMEQARAILEHRIPYRVAATVVRQMTPTVLLALIDRMSPQG